MLNIGLIGANGKVGKGITQLIASNPNHYTLATAIVKNGTQLSLELTQTARLITTEISQSSKVKVFIDFSNPQTTLNALSYCLKQHIPLVIGTTGFTNVEFNTIKQGSCQIPILFAPNMSLSVNLLFKLAHLAAAKLPEFEAEIIEAHHRYKKDAPSGTALKLGKTIANARNIDFTKYANYFRHGSNQEIRDKHEIGFSVIRGGDIVGMHELMLIGDGETLHLKTETKNRLSYAKGALLAAQFLVTQQPGLYDMFNVLKI